MEAAGDLFDLDGKFGFSSMKDDDVKQNTLNMIESFDIDNSLPDDDNDLDLDETLVERIIGLREMFPEKIRNVLYYNTQRIATTSRKVWNFSQQASWIIFSSAIILVVPVSIEKMRMEIEQNSLDKQRQILLGPNAHISNSPLQLPMMPPTPHPNA